MSSKLLSVHGIAVIVGCTVMIGTSPAKADGIRSLLDDFEGETPSNPVDTLRRWDIIETVDVTIDDPPACRRTGQCLDLVGTSDINTGGIVSKRSFADGTYTVAFQLYGSLRDTIDKVRVFFANKLIYSNNQITSDFSRFVVIRNVSGPGKLKFIGIGQVANIGPLVDNVVVLPR